MTTDAAPVSHSTDPSSATAVGSTAGEPSKLSPPVTATAAPDAGAGAPKQPTIEKSGAAVAPAKRESSGADTPTKVKRRKGFWAQFVSACVPCTSAEGHDIDPTPKSTAAVKARPPPSDQSSLDSKEKEKNRHSALLPVDASISTTLDAAGYATALQDNGTAPARELTPEPRTDDVDADSDVVVSPTANTHNTLPDSETGGVTAGAVQAPGQTETDIADEIDDEEDRLILNGGMGIPIGPDGQPQPLLPELYPQHEGRKCLVLDLDETLVHSSFKMIPQADYVIPVLIEHQLHNVYVVKRPGVDQFLEQMGKLYEVVVFTASLSMYADPVLDKLDIHKAVSHRLFREHCYNHKGVYVKDLSQLGRPIEGTIILDNSPASYIFHPNNAVPVSSWFSDPHDTELTDMCPFLDDLRAVDDVRGVLDGGL